MTKRHAERPRYSVCRNRPHSNARNATCSNVKIISIRQIQQTKQQLVEIIGVNINARFLPIQFNRSNRNACFREIKLSRSVLEMAAGRSPSQCLPLFDDMYRARLETVHFSSKLSPLRVERLYHGHKHTSRPKSHSTCCRPVILILNQVHISPFKYTS